MKMYRQFRVVYGVLPIVILFYPNIVNFVVLKISFLANWVAMKFSYFVYFYNIITKELLICFIHISTSSAIFIHRRVQPGVVGTPP